MIVVILMEFVVCLGNKVKGFSSKADVVVSMTPLPLLKKKSTLQG